MSAEGSATADCLTCRQTEAFELPPREAIVRTRHWRVAHAFDSSLAGWLVVVPTRHVTALDDLSREEMSELGPLLRDLTSALRAVVGSAKTYVMLLAEAEGFAHVHFHVLPRMPDQPPSLRGPRVFAYLGRPEGVRLSDAAMDHLAGKLRSRLPEWRTTPQR